MSSAKRWSGGRHRSPRGYLPRRKVKRPAGAKKIAPFISSIVEEKDSRGRKLAPVISSRGEEKDRRGQRIAPVISGKLPEKDARGRKAHSEAPKEEIADALGVSDRSYRRAEQHVAAVEKYPELAAPGIPLSG